MRYHIISHLPHLSAAVRFSLVAVTLVLWLSLAMGTSADSTDDPGRIAERAHLLSQTTVPVEADHSPPEGPHLHDEQSDALLRDARNIVASHLGLSPGRTHDILLASWENVTWPDSSLGCPKEGMAYAAVMTPGARLSFSYRSKYVIVHMEETGRYGFVPVDCLHSEKFGPDAIPGGVYREPRDEAQQGRRMNRPVNPMAQVILPGDGFLRVRVSWDPPFPSGIVSVRTGAKQGEHKYHEPYKEATGYTVIRNDGLTFAVDAPLTLVTDLNVLPGEQYTYTVIAHGSEEDSLPSDFAAIRIPHAPAAPRDLHAEVRLSPSSDRATVLLTWEPATVPWPNTCVVSFPVQKYRLQRIEGGDAVRPLGEMGQKIARFEDTEARRKMTYTYRLVAVSAVGDGPAAMLEVTIP